MSFHGVQCISSHSHEQGEPETETVGSEIGDFGSTEEEEEQERAVMVAEVGGELAELGLWKQMKEIVKFAGPALGLWICGPLMSLIDTAVIGQGSSVELAALGNLLMVYSAVPLFLIFNCSVCTCQEISFFMRMRSFWTFPKEFQSFSPQCLDMKTERHYLIY